MWQTEYTAETELGPDRIWRALRALETGEVPMASGDLREAKGPFEVGGTIVSTPVGIDPLDSTITELVPDRILAVQTSFNSLVLLLRHVLVPAATAGPGSCGSWRSPELPPTNKDPWPDPGSARTTRKHCTS